MVDGEYGQFVDGGGATAPRERLLGPGSGRLLLMAGIFVAPLVITGYVGLTVLLFLPLLGRRLMFPRPIRVFGPPLATARA